MMLTPQTLALISFIAFLCGAVSLITMKLAFDIADYADENGFFWWPVPLLGLAALSIWCAVHGVTLLASAYRSSENIGASLDFLQSTRSTHFYHDVTIEAICPSSPAIDASVAINDTIQKAAYIWSITTPQSDAAGWSIEGATIAVDFSNSGICRLQHPVVIKDPVWIMNGIFQQYNQANMHVGPQLADNSIDGLFSGSFGNAPQSEQKNSSYSQFWSVRGDKLLPSERDLGFGAIRQSNCGGPHAKSGESQNQGEQRYRVAGRLLPKGFAFACIVAGLFGALVTRLFLSRGGDI